MSAKLFDSPIFIYLMSNTNIELCPVIRKMLSNLILTCSTDLDSFGMDNPDILIYRRFLSKSIRATDRLFYPESIP